MLISYNWLKNYAAFDEGPEELATILTDSGLEVEGLDRYESVRGGLRGVVTGQVLTCRKHPDADKLKVTTVDVGGDAPLPIVCGAPNVAEGQKVLVALPGATLYTAKGELPIKKAKIRGEVSQGMICAEDELGLGDSHEGILVLPGNTPEGQPAADFFNVAEDWVFEIGLTPNRIDAASHIGVARDIVAVHNHRRRKKELLVTWPDVSHFAPDHTDVPVPVGIDDPAACPRYSSLTISGITVAESPGWLKNKLQAIGLKPINNVVDITNFILHETGQPLHAFDLAKVRGNKVVVRKPPRGTRFVTLDGEEVELTGDDLMICDAEGPMCMAGILGGTGSGVTGMTTSLFLESACFDPVTIRKSSKHHGIKTDASFRFERGADPEITPYALRRAALLIREVAGGAISSDIRDDYPGKREPLSIWLDFGRTRTLIGKDLEEEEIVSILEDLDFVVKKRDRHGVQVTVPTYRVDVTRDADVIEEVLRIYGYNNVEVPARMHASIVASPKPDKEKLQNTISGMLVARGFHEIINNSLTKASHYTRHGFDPGASVPIENPLSQDLNVLRQSLLFGGLETVAHNQNRKVHDLKLFEFGNVYRKVPGAGNGDDPLAPYRERMLLGIWMTGNDGRETWYEKDRGVGFFDLKNTLYTILRRLGADHRAIRQKALEGHERFAYGMDLFWDDSHVARIGLLPAAIARGFDIRSDVFYGMLEWDTVVALSARQTTKYSEVPRFPEVRRDLALLLDRSVPFDEIERLAYETEKKLLREVNLFDVYQDEKLGTNKKSYAVSFILRDDNKTLTDKEVDRVMEKLTRTYEKRLDASIR